MPYPKVCVVVVNWNKKDYVLKLLEALRHINYDNYDIVIVDNASTDGSAEVIKRKFPEVILIQNEENLGGTGGFNTGMRYALKKGDYKYIWWLDNDAMVEKDTLVELLKVIEADEKIGIAGSMILNPEKKEYVVELGGFVNWELGIWKPNLRNKLVAEIEDEVVEVGYVAACSAIVKTDVLKKIGIMDERMFLHWDDIDLCLRCKRAGYKVVATKNSVIYHGVEKSIPPVFLYYDTRNALICMSKHLNSMDKITHMLNL